MGSVNNKALLCYSKHGFDTAFPYLKPLMDLLDDVKHVDEEESRWRAFARLFRFYEGCIAMASPYWMQHGQMLWEYVAARTGL